MARLIIETTVIINDRVIPHTHSINGIDSADIDESGMITVHAKGKKYKDFKDFKGRKIDSWRVEAD